jgi:hypothetical protein
LQKILYGFIVFSGFCCEGGHFTLAPTIYKKLFGLEGSMRVWMVGACFSGMASFTMIVIDTWILEWIGLRTLSNAFGVLNIIALAILHLQFREEPVGQS